MKGRRARMLRSMHFRVRLLGFDFCWVLASYLIPLIPILQRTEADNSIYHLTGMLWRPNGKKKNNLKYLANCPAHTEPSINISYLLFSSIIITIIIIVYLLTDLVSYPTLIPMSILCFTPNALICTPWKCFLLSWHYTLELMPFLTLGTPSVSSLLSSFHREILLSIFQT